MAQRYSDAQITQALRETGGLIFLAARKLGCSRHTIQRRAKASAAVRDALEDCRGELVDTAELKLRSAVIDGQAWAIALVLRTLGRDRGYVEQLDLGGKVRLELVEEIVEPGSPDPDPPDGTPPPRAA